MLEAIPVPAGAPKVDILLFTYRSTPFIAHSAIYAMAIHSRLKGIDVTLTPYGSALIEDSRNMATAKIRRDADFVLYCDDDMLPRPHCLEWLMKLDAPLAAPLFTTRSEPVVITLKEWDAAEKVFKPVGFKDGFENKALKGNFAIGMALTLIRRDCLDTVREYVLSARDWMDEHRGMMDRLHVRSENREKERQRIEAIRREAWAADYTANIFRRERTDRDDSYGEDISFGRRLMGCGIESVVDTRENNYVGHLGDYAYGPWDFGSPNNLKDFAERLRK